MAARNPLSKNVFLRPARPSWRRDPRFVRADRQGPSTTTPERSVATADDRRPLTAIRIREPCAGTWLSLDSSLASKAPSYIPSDRPFHRIRQTADPADRRGSSTTTLERSEHG